MLFFCSFYNAIKFLRCSFSNWKNWSVLLSVVHSKVTIVQWELFLVFKVIVWNWTEKFTFIGRWASFFVLSWGKSRLLVNCLSTEHGAGFADWELRGWKRHFITPSSDYSRFTIAAFPPGPSKSKVILTQKHDMNRSVIINTVLTILIDYSTPEIEKFLYISISNEVSYKVFTGSKTTTTARYQHIPPRGEKDAGNDEEEKSNWPRKFCILDFFPLQIVQRPRVGQKFPQQSPSLFGRRVQRRRGFSLEQVQVWQKIVRAFPALQAGNELQQDPVDAVKQHHVHPFNLARVLFALV